MLGSIYVGLSGMLSYSSGLRLVSNNITNLNSVGYKATLVSFGGMLGQQETVSGFSRFQTPTGRGVSVQQARLDFSQGELRQSDRDLDLAVDGSGFFVLEKDGELSYARTGRFEVNSDGDIVLAGTDYRLMRLDEDKNLIVATVGADQSFAPEASTRVEFTGNLSSAATSHTIQDITVYDAQGEPIELSISFTRDDNSDDESWAFDVLDASGESLQSGTLEISDGQILGDTGEISVNLQNDQTVVLDFSEGVTYFSSGSLSSLSAEDADGFPFGELQSITVDDRGYLSASYTNGEIRDLGAVALADLNDPQALIQNDIGVFDYAGYEQVAYLTSDAPNVGKVLPRRSEASNVDLSEQFGDLILVQRGYQASSQVVCVSNDMIQQLFGIRGQG